MRLKLTAPDDLLTFLEKQGRRWVNRVRQEYRPLGRTLTSAEMGAMAHYFDATLLDNVRIAKVPGIANPDFYSVFLEQSVAIPLDVAQMSAITFVDTILLSTSHSVPAGEQVPLLFHELVHVQQYTALGVAEFVKRYVRGWASNGFQYSAIPLERQAYELEARFRSGVPAFSVSDEVKRALAEAA